MNETVPVQAVEPAKCDQERSCAESGCNGACHGVWPDGTPKITQGKED